MFKTLSDKSSIAPPSVVAKFLMKVTLFNVNDPLVYIAPPLSALPPVKIRLLNVTLFAVMLNILDK